MKTVLAELIQGNNIAYHGFAGHLIPRDITHILKVLIIANREYRIENAVRQEGILDKEANQKIRKSDNDSLRWTHYLFEKTPWNSSLYDMVIPIHSSSIDEAVMMICDHAKKDAVTVTESSQAATEGFLLSSNVNQALVKKDHLVDVQSKNGHVTIFINTGSKTAQCFVGYGSWIVGTRC